MDASAGLVIESQPCGCVRCTAYFILAKNWMERNSFTQLMCKSPGCAQKGIKYFAKGDSQKLRCRCECGHFRTMLESHQWSGYPVFECTRCASQMPFLTADNAFQRVSVEEATVRHYHCPFCADESREFVALVPRQVADEMLTTTREKLCARINELRKKLARAFDAPSLSN